MKKQDYSNYRRYYTPHHFIFYPIAFALITISFFFIFKYPDRSSEWSIITAILLLITWLSFMMRQHYSIVPQNRIIRLELRLRYYQLTGQSFEPIESRLSFGQLAALRFASDAELPALVERTLQGNLPPSVIKKSIKDWQADNMRV